MKKILMFILIFNAVIAHAESKRSHFINGHELLKMCNSLEKLSKDADYEEFYAHVGCVKYIDGVSDTYFIFSVKYDEVSRLCYPDDISAYKRALIVSNYLEENSNELNKSALALIINALRDTYTCD